MELDLKNATMLLELITKRRSAYGKAASVEVRQESPPLALVQMSRRAQTEKVASRHQGSEFGNAALVRLERKAE
jgi:hypothetical protein